MRWHGFIGYATSVESPAGSGIFIDSIEEIERTGEQLKYVRRVSEDSEVNNSVRYVTEISVLADKFIQDRLDAIRYVTLYGRKYIVTSTDVAERRFNMTIGGLYHEDGETV